MRTPVTGLVAALVALIVVQSLMVPADPGVIPRGITVQASAAAPYANVSIDVSPDEVQYGEILTVGVHGPSNASLRVWILYEGVRRTDRYNITLDANGTSSSSRQASCSLQEVLDDTCAWPPGSYTALVSDRSDDILNRTRFTVRLNDRMLWLLGSGNLRRQHDDAVAAQNAQWAFILILAAAISVAIIVFCFFLWIEVSGPIGLPDKLWRLVRSMPRLAGSVFFARDDPYMSNLKKYPGENRPERYRQNAQSYMRRRDHEIRTMDRLEKRKERLMVRATHWERGAQYWTEKETAENGRSLL